MDLLNYIDAEDLSEFIEPIVQNNMVDDRLVAFPWYTNLGGMYYRADLLRKYGFAEPPRTWDELRNMSRTIVDGEKGTGLWGYATQLKVCRRVSVLPSPVLSPYCPQFV